MNPSDSRNQIIDCPRNESRPLSPSSRQRSVHFCESISISVFKKEVNDIEHSWYSRSDEHRFRQDMRDEVLRFRSLAYGAARGGDGDSVISTDSINSIVTGEMTSFGLEHMISRVLYARRNQLKRAVVQAVLAAQCHQEEGEVVVGNGNDRDKRLALASMLFSEWGRDRAKEIGSFYAMVTLEERC